MLRNVTALGLLTLAIFLSYAPLSVYASAGASQISGGCPTYLTNITIDLVNSAPTQVTTGDVVMTQVHVIYPDGTPVTLAPQTISFLWNGTAGSKQYDNVPVTSTDNPGFYNYTQTITADLAQATLGASGSGELTVYVVTCSCSDARGNRGPTTLIGSDETLTPSDTSHLNVGPVTQPQQPITYLVPLAIALLLIIALLLLLLRSRRKKK